MKAVPGLLRRQSLRARITLAYVATGALLALVMAFATFLTARAFLESQRIRSTTRQTIFTLVFARDFIAAEPNKPDELVSLLRTRGSFEAMVTTSSDWFASELSLTPAALPEGLRTLVANERLAYQFTDVGGVRTIVLGAPLPPPGTDLYLLFSLSDVDDTLSLLARILAVTGLGVVAIATILAQRVSVGLLHPLRMVSAAAQRVAEGLLETRVEAKTNDEVGLLAASFNEMAAELQDMIARERRFVAGVSHELRTPLTALGATSELLTSRRDELSPPLREAADLVAEDIANLRRLVEELMEVSEIDSGKAVVRWEKLGIRSHIEAVVARRHYDAVVTGEDVSTYIDKARLERIAGNLIDNAYEHGEGRGVRVHVSSGGGRFDIEVADEGPGIPADALPHLFDRFYKTDASRTRERGGIGLGLAIAADNARLLGGEITAASPAGGGARFLVRLPLRTEEPG